MKTIIYLSILLMSFPLSLPAQWKEQEKSHKTRPSWVGGAERNYLIVSAEALTLEAAKEKILLNLREQIVGSIATRIQSETTMQKHQTTVNNEINYTEEVSSYIRSKVAHIPFISEVSLSKAKEFYWIKLFNKKEKSYKYEYHIKYLFSDIDATQLVNQFKEREERLNCRLTVYSDALSELSTVEQIGRTLNELKAFIQEFDADDPRRLQTEQLSNNYRQLYNQIRIELIEEPGGDNILIGLRLGDRTLRSGQSPQLLANCATRLSATIEGESYKISYDNSACYADDDNYIDIRFRFGNKIVSKRIHLP